MLLVPLLHHRSIHEPASGWEQGDTCVCLKSMLESRAEHCLSPQQ